jgi:hypothetical protein
MVAVVAVAGEQTTPTTAALLELLVAWVVLQFHQATHLHLLLAAAAQAEP